MKQELLQSLENLKGFLLNIDSINKHPYSKGVDVEKRNERYSRKNWRSIYRCRRTTWRK